MNDIKIIVSSILLHVNKIPLTILLISNIIILVIITIMVVKEIRKGVDE